MTPTPLDHAKDTARSGDYAGALPLFQALDGAEARYGEGACLYKLNQPEPARAALQHALEADPTHAAARALLGKLTESAPAAPRPGWRKRLVPFEIAFLVLLGATGFVIKISEVLSNEGAAPTYTVGVDDVYDAPVKTMVTRPIFLDGPADREQVEQILQIEHNKLARTTGYRYHPHPTMVVVDVYRCRADMHLGKGNWLARRMNDKVITSDEAFWPEEEMQHGLDLATRRQIFAELSRRENAAWRQAEQLHPGDAAAAVLQQGNYVDGAHEATLQALATKHQVSVEVVNHIMVDGIRRRWPHP